MDQDFDFFIYLKLLQCDFMSWISFLTDLLRYLVSGIFLQKVDETWNKSWVRENELAGLAPLLGCRSMAVLSILESPSEQRFKVDYCINSIWIALI